MHQCRDSILYLRGCRIAFEGYQPEEVDSIRYISYKAGSGFTQPVDSGWVYTDSFSVEDEKVHKRIQTDSFTTFVELKAGLDYKIITPSKRHTITNIETGPPLSNTYTSTSHCKRNANVAPFTSLRVDGDSVNPIEAHWLDYFAYLKK